MINFLIAILCIFSTSAKASDEYTFIHEATSAPPVSFYDYIIVGGGTAGCPLAATLSENARVILLERGGSPYGNPNITDIINFASSISDTSPTSPAQPFISEDGVINTRPRILGGGTALNAGFYSRAGKNSIKENGWDEELVNKSFEWVEKKVAFHPPMLDWQSAVKDGLIEAGVLPYNGFTFDHIYGTKIGGTIFDSNGYRHTAADLLEYADANHIHVYIHANVHNILYSTDASRRAYGVIFEDDLGVKHTAYLFNNTKNEIILSAGALGSPQLLMLSGIGPAEHLTAHGIQLVMNQPMVGQGMADNPMNGIFIPSPIPVEVSLAQVVGISPSDNFIEAMSGMNFFYTWVQNLNHSQLVLKQIGQHSSITLQDMSQAIETKNSYSNPNLQGGVIIEKFLGPLSVGYLNLKTTDPRDNPSVTFNYFKETEDLQRCVQGMKTVINVINSKSFSRFRNSSVEDLINAMVNSRMNLRPKHANASHSLEQFCIDTVMSMWHYHGGCQVGKVVDHDYKVYGVDSLRVVDGSTFHSTPGTNPQATMMMLGRYMGEKIIQERF